MRQSSMSKASAVEIAQSQAPTNLSCSNDFHTSADCLQDAACRNVRYGSERETQLSVTPYPLLSTEVNLMCQEKGTIDSALPPRQLSAVTTSSSRLQSVLCEASDSTTFDLSAAASTTGCVEASPTFPKESSNLLPRETPGPGETVRTFRREDVMRLAFQSKELAGKTCDWVIYKQNVYDLGNYLATGEHPGGNSVLEQSVGLDITEAFEAIGHSQHAQLLLSSFKIGTLIDESSSSLDPLSMPLDSRSVRPADTLTSSSVELRKDPYVDFTAPLIPQVYRLTKRQYVDFTSEFFCGSRVCDFFPNPVLETLSRTVWWVIPALWLPVALALFLYSRTQFALSLDVSLICTSFGVFLWTLFEYIIHRFAFHFPEEALPDLAFIRVIHFLGHGVHHVLPMDRMRLVMPPALFFILAAPMYAIFILFLPLWFVNITLPGVIAGYVAYDMIHYASHHFVVENLPLLGYMKHYHMKHHFKEPCRGFGVSTPFWDHVFHTQL